jgi:hypothetical protein
MFVIRELAHDKLLNLQRVDVQKAGGLALNPQAIFKAAADPQGNQFGQ